MSPHELARRIAALEPLAMELAARRALAAARQMPNEAFAQTLVDALPSKGPGTVELDLDLLNDAELELLAALVPN